MSKDNSFTVQDREALGWQLDLGTGRYYWAAGSAGNGDSGGGGGSYTAGNGITIDGDTIKMSGNYSGTFTANVLKGTS